MKKIIVLIALSLSLIACNDSGSVAEESQAVYGVDYVYDDTHPEEISVDEAGNLEPFNISVADVVSECGRSFYKDDTTGNVFYAEVIDGSWKAKQIGYYQAYDEFLGGFQTVGYINRQIVSVGKHVVMSSYTGLSDYFDWTRVNYQHVFTHDNCMVIIDEENQDVLSVNLSTEVTTSIF